MRLSFDVESIFHDVSDPAAYRPLEVFEYLINFLKLRGISSTFYMVSDYAVEFPFMARAIVANGHEIGSHSKSHAYLNRADHIKITQELQISKCTLEDITGSSVTKFRAPAFRVPENITRYYDELIRCGYTFDSSVIQFDNSVKDHYYKGTLFLSYVRPVATWFGLPILAGGKYSRVIPYFLFKYMTLNSQELYFHLHDFDPNVSIHPIKKLSRSAISRVTANNCQRFLEQHFK